MSGWVSSTWTTIVPRKIDTNLVDVCWSPSLLRIAFIRINLGSQQTGFETEEALERKGLIEGLRKRFNISSPETYQRNNIRFPTITSLFNIVLYNLVNYSAASF